MFAQFRQSVRGALDARDGEFSDYRTEPKEWRGVV